MRIWMMLLTVLLPMFGSASVDAQLALPSYQSQRHRQRPTLTGVAPEGRPRLGFGTSSYRGFQTRTDRIRAISQVPRMRRGLLADPLPSISPISRMLDSRNLLRPRSALGRRAVAMIGRHDYLPTAPGQRLGTLQLRPTSSQASPQTPVGGTLGRYDDNLAARLEDKADEYFDLGIGYFRNGDPQGAQHCFQIVKTLQHDRPRAWVADVFVAYETKDYNRAVLSLLRALERSEALSDLKIDRFIERMYQGKSLEEKRLAFRRTVESVNLDVKSQRGAQRLNLLLAYFAWLNGDHATAISAATIAENAMGKRYRPVVATFRQRLSSERAQPPADAPGA